MRVRGRATGRCFATVFRKGLFFVFWKKEGRCVALMCLAAFLQGMVFYGPVASLYRTQAGLSMGDIALIESVYYLLVVALELPLGAVAARLGYKRMLAVCSAVFFLSKLVFWRAACSLSSALSRWRQCSRACWPW